MYCVIVVNNVLCGENQEQHLTSDCLGIFFLLFFLLILNYFFIHKGCRDNGVLVGK